MTRAALADILFALAVVLAVVSLVISTGILAGWWG